MTDNLKKGSANAELADCKKREKELFKFQIVDSDKSTIVNTAQKDK